MWFNCFASAAAAAVPLSILNLTGPETAVVLFDFSSPSPSVEALLLPALSIPVSVCGACAGKRVIRLSSPPLSSFGGEEMGSLLLEGVALAGSFVALLLPALSTSGDSGRVVLLATTGFASCLSIMLGVEESLFVGVVSSGEALLLPAVGVSTLELEGTGRRRGRDVWLLDLSMLEGGGEFSVVLVVLFASRGFATVLFPALTGNECEFDFVGRGDADDVRSVRLPSTAPRISSELDGECSVEDSLTLPGFGRGTAVLFPASSCCGQTVVSNVDLVGGDSFVMLVSP